jgi:hypothetical protein
VAAAPSRQTLRKVEPDEGGSAQEIVSARIFGCQIAPGEIKSPWQWSLPTRDRVNRLTISELMTPADVPRNARTLAGVFL